jgi:hypothetical protein
MAVTSAPIQGINAPDVVVDPDNFYKATRRMRFAMSPLKAISALGSVDNVQLRQVGIVAALEVRVQGSLTFGGTIGTTTMSYDWPYNLIQNLTLSANGQSNLISARGLTLKAYDFITNPRLDDTGITQQFGGAAITSGSLSLPSDTWGNVSTNVTAPGTNVAATGTYNFDFTLVVPVAADQTSLIGSIYAQSSATNLSLNVQWATQSQIVSALGGAATFASSINWQVTGVAYSIPNVNGRFVVPDLSQFHQLSENRAGGLVQGTNQIILPGTGVGRQLLRLFWNTYSGATPAPLAMNATNYGQVDWAYGGNDTPEAYPNGTQLRAWNIHVAGVDIGGSWGFGLWDFANIFALRDSVDEGATTNLRLEFALVSSPTSGFAQVAQETLFAAPVGA